MMGVSPIALVEERIDAWSLTIFFLGTSSFLICACLVLVQMASASASSPPSALDQIREIIERELAGEAEALKDRHEAWVNELKNQHKKNVDALEKDKEQLLHRISEIEKEINWVKSQHSAEILEMGSQIEGLNREKATLTQQLKNVHVLAKNIESKTIEALQNIKLFRDEAEILKNELNGWEEWCKGLTSRLKPKTDMDFCFHGHLTNQTSDASPGKKDQKSVVRNETNDKERTSSPNKRLSPCSSRKPVKSKGESAKHGGQDVEDTYIQEIFDYKTLFKVRWVGCGPEKDSWEPLEDVAHTGHVDRFLIQRRTIGLKEGMPGVGILESKITSERFLVDLSQETLYLESDKADKGVDTALVDNCSGIKQGESILWFWEYMGCNVPCKVLSFTPLESDPLGLTAKLTSTDSTFNNVVALGFENLLLRVLKQNQQMQAKEVKALSDSYAAQEKDMMKKMAVLEEENRNGAVQLNDKASALADLSLSLEKANKVKKDLTNQLNEQKSKWNEEQSRLNRKLDELSESSSRDQQRIKDFHCKKRTWREEKERMQTDMEKQKNEWKEMCDELHHKLAREIVAKRDFQALRKSCNIRMQDMKRQYEENTKSMANKTILRCDQLRAEHEKREAESRHFYQKENEQNYYKLKAYYENEIATLNNKFIQRDTELHQLYKSKIEGLTSNVQDLEKCLVMKHQTEPSNSSDLGCEQDETEHEEIDKVPSFAQALFENQPCIDKETDTRPPKKRKIEKSKSSMPLKQDNDQSDGGDESGDDPAFL
eukprot:CCRYP_003083-RA/>CCRYP_003083-RA protein AED:0.03 eAED:0.03 QI:1827/1/1/1/0.66/0.5/4/162/771